MDSHHRELLVARITSGTVRLQVAGRASHILVVRKPTREQLYLAQEIYSEQLYLGGLEGLFDEDDLYDYLLENDLWDEGRQSLLKALPKEVEDFKVKLFKANFRSNERKVVREALRVAKAKLSNLEQERHAHDHLSCSGYASLARSRFIMGCSLHDTAGHPLFPDESFWEEPSDLLDMSLAAYAQARLDESTFRELARTDPWRSIWATRRAESSLFGVHAVDQTDEQRALTAFSSLYDSVAEHPDCPADEVVEDDDLLDGWLIDQRRERAKRLNSKAGEDLIQNEKVRGSQEVFLVADTAEDAHRVMDLNDEHARVVQKRRFNHLRQQGEVNELEMPDTRQRLRMEATQRLSQAMQK